MASARGKFLASVLGLNWVVVVFVLPWAQACDHCLPRWHTSNCASRNVFAHSRTASKLGASWWVRKLTIASATSGCLRFTLGMQSAQLAQCAASTLPAAKHKPKPPKFMVTPAALLASSESPAMPTNWQKHCHTAPSRASTKLLRQSRSHHAKVEIGSKDRGIQQQEPRTLKIPHCVDFLQQTGLFGCRGVQLGPHELVATNRCSQATVLGS